MTTLVYKIEWKNWRVVWSSPNLMGRRIHRKCEWRCMMLLLRECRQRTYIDAAVYTFYLINMKKIKPFYVRLENLYSNSSQYMLRNQYYMKWGYSFIMSTLGGKRHHLYIRTLNQIIRRKNIKILELQEKLESSVPPQEIYDSKKALSAMKKKYKCLRRYPKMKKSVFATDWWWRKRGRIAEETGGKGQGNRPAPRWQP